MSKNKIIHLRGTNQKLFIARFAQRHQPVEVLELESLPDDEFEPDFSLTTTTATMMSTMIKTVTPIIIQSFLFLSQNFFLRFSECFLNWLAFSAILDDCFCDENIVCYKYCTECDHMALGQIFFWTKVYSDTRDSHWPRFTLA